MPFELSFIAAFFKVNNIQSSIYLRFATFVAVVCENRALQDVKHFIVFLLDCYSNLIDLPVSVADEKLALSVDFSQVEIEQPKYRCN